MAHLGVNIDHVATIRQARQASEPDPVWAAVEAELGGADCITVHLREDRRHIQDRDVRLLKETVAVKLNLEMACAEEIVGIACQVRPQQATIVPEKRQEITTEGGLDVLADRQRVGEVIRRLHDAGIEVSLFLDPALVQLEAAKELAADAVELHTGQYALAAGELRAKQLESLVEGAALVQKLGMTLHAGHGLNYHNVQPVVNIAGMSELNIGHSIVARAVFVGMQQAVREMKRLIAGPA